MVQLTLEELIASAGIGDHHAAVLLNGKILCRSSMTAAELLVGLAGKPANRLVVSAIEEDIAIAQAHGRPQVGICVVGNNVTSIVCAQFLSQRFPLQVDVSRI